MFTKFAPCNYSSKLSFTKKTKIPFQNGKKPGAFTACLSRFFFQLPSVFSYNDLFSSLNITDIFFRVKDIFFSMSDMFVKKVNIFY